MAYEGMSTSEQRNYIIALINGKNLSTLTPEQQAWLAVQTEDSLTQISKEDAHKIINTLRPLDWTKKTPPAVPFN